MRKAVGALSIVGLILTFSASAFAQVIPRASVTIGKQVFNLDVVQQGKLFTIAPVTLTVPDIGSVAISQVTGNPDPFVTYGFTATNFSTSPDFFAFDFEIPITMCPAGSTVFSSLSAGLTDALGDGVTITPADLPMVQMATGNTTLDIGDVGPAQTSGPPAGSYTYGPFSTTTIAPVELTSLDIHAHFILSGDFDTASLTGLVNCQAVPEPSSLALLVGLGMSGTLFGLKLRRRS